MTVRRHFSNIPALFNAPVAQLIEYLATNQVVGSSNLSGRVKIKKPAISDVFYLGRDQNSRLAKQSREFDKSSGLTIWTAEGCPQASAQDEHESISLEHTKSFCDHKNKNLASESLSSNNDDLDSRSLPSHPHPTPLPHSCLHLKERQRAREGDSIHAVDNLRNFKLDLAKITAKEIKCHTAGTHKQSSTHAVNQILSKGKPPKPVKFL